jgi:hypothetical protein
MTTIVKKLNSAAIVDAALSDVVEATSVAINLATLPLGIFTVTHATTQRTNQPKIILESSNASHGTIQLYAKNDVERAELYAMLEDGDVIDGSQNQDGPHFKLSNGTNYQYVKAATAHKLMEVSNQNSTPMAFGPKINVNSIADNKAIKAINNDNVGAAAVAVDGGAMAWISSKAKGFFS